MKTCPVCQAIAFDDAQTCFGCMYQFDEKNRGEDLRSWNGEACDRQNESSVSESGGWAVPPAFVVRVVPVLEDAGCVSWTCSVDFVTP